MAGFAGAAMAGVLGNLSSGTEGGEGTFGASGGLSAGKGEIRDGKGTFSEVSDIKELFGTYAAAEASAGVVKNAAASVVTKGEVTLGLEGKGTGWELGIAFGKVTITRK